MPERRQPAPVPSPLRRVLIVDDDENWRYTLVERLREEGFETYDASGGERALEILEKRDVDLILADVRMPGMDGWALLEEIRKRNISEPVIMMSGYGDENTALQVIQQGADDFISKPDTDDIILTLRKADERERLRLENVRLREEIQRDYDFDSIVAQSPKMLEIFAIVRKIAEYKTTVLITGESGTGKELIARAVHFNSPRASNPFVAINCGAIPENLLESELFGHVKGSFTDAVRDKKGLFEQAHTGSLFLDEVGELPLNLQVKLLRVLQEGEIRPVGADKTTPVDVRIIAATVKDLEKEAREGKFRDDLYYRLNVLSVQPPPLRERREDIPLLADHFLEKHCAKLGLPKRAVSKSAMKLLVDYHWPGNVRELENAVERTIILSDGEIQPEHLPQQILEPNPAANSADDMTADNTLSLKQRVRRLEQELIRKALQLTNQNRTKAARVLDISHRTLLYKMNEYNIK